MSEGPDLEMREERKVVTAMFADLVGSTALAERLDPEDLKLVVNDAITRVIGAVEAYGGTVKDLAGDGVLALFGAPQTHEDDPERATRAALQATQEIAAYARDVEQAFGVEGFNVRVGVATGPVVVGAVGAGSRVEYGALGDAVNIAARLQSAADPGTVLVGSHTRRRIALLFDWSEPAELALKGKADPVVAYRLEGVRAAPGGPRGAGPAQTPLVGRERELAEARTAVDAALAGSGRILFVTGEPGIGKSRLLAELRQLVERATPEHGRALWIEGRCVSYGESMPYWPFRDLLRSWLGVLADEPELRVRVALRRSVSRLFGARVLEIYPYLGAMLGLSLEPDAQARLDELSPEALQYRTFEVVRALIARLAQDGPVVVALEDLHWADATSLQLLELLLGDSETSALLLVLTTRPERDHPSWRVKEDAARELPHRTREIALDALSGDAGRELLHALIGQATLPAEMERRILEPAEGNPFFLEEIVRSLADVGALERVAGSWRFDHAVEVEVPADRREGDPGPHRPPGAGTAHGAHGGVGARPAVRAAAARGRHRGQRVGRAVPQRAAAARPPAREPAVAGAGVPLQARPHPGGRVPDPRRTGANEVAPQGRGLARGHVRRAARTRSPACSPTTGSPPRTRTRPSPTSRGRATEPGRTTRSTRRSATTASCCRSSSAAASGGRSRSSCSSSRSRCTCRCASSRRTRPTSARSSTGRRRSRRPATPTAVVRIGTSFLPNDPDPRSAIAWPNIQLCMQLFDRLVEAWPERTIVPSLAERWEIAPDGLRYVFHLREGLRWSDGEPLTAHDVEFGIKRVLNPDAPGSSVAIYFVLENGQDYYLRRNDDADAIGVRALDDRTVEFRLAAPAPVLPERDEPPRRRSAAPARDRAPRRRLGGARRPGRERPVPGRVEGRRPGRAGAA